MAIRGNIELDVTAGRPSFRHVKLRRKGRGLTHGGRWRNGYHRKRYEGFTFATGVDVTAAKRLNELGEPGVTVATPIAVGNGGTNATTASAARTNLGLGTIATQAAMR